MRGRQRRANVELVDPHFDFVARDDHPQVAGHDRRRASAEEEGRHEGAAGRVEGAAREDQPPTGREEEAVALQDAVDSVSPYRVRRHEVG